jgi:Ca2+/H+ antiporter, TMEM165/GDT1 family
MQLSGLTGSRPGAYKFGRLWLTIRLASQRPATARDMRALRLAVYVFGVIFVAELPDKTALAALVLATRYKPLAVFLGASLALTVQSIVAVAAGSLLSALPAHPVRIGAGCVFLASAVVMWMRNGAPQGPDSTAAHADPTGPRQEVEKGSEENRAGRDEAGKPGRSAPFWRSLATSFGVVFVAEWGDLTQFATAAFAAHNRAPLVVFVAATAALWAVAGIAVGIGHHAAKLLDPKITKRVAAALFATVGVVLIAGWL